MSTTLNSAELSALGLAPAEAHRLANQLSSLPERPPEELWPIVCERILHADLPPAVHVGVHRHVFRDWPDERGPAPAWFPTDEIVSRTNIAKLQEEHGLPNYSALYEWSIAQRAEFWDAMIRKLCIRFQKPYHQVLDPQSSPQQPRWLVGAEFNITDSCFQAAPDAVAVRFSKPDNSLATWTYAELEVLTARVAGGLQRLGLTPGDRVAIDMPMSPESVPIYLGIIRSGCVAVSIADSFAAAEIAMRLRISGAKAIFTQDHILRGGKRLPLYERICEADAPAAIVVPGDGASVPLRPGDRSWEKFLEGAPRAAAVMRHAHDHTNYLFSSGTTGEPKIIPFNHIMPIKCAVEGFIHQDIQPGDIVAWPTNLGWMMGPWLIYASLINRATIALFHDAPTGRSFGQFVQDSGVTMLGVIPSLVGTWKSSGCMQGLDWSAIKCFSSTGECSNADDMLWLMARAGYKPVIEYCGGTELAGGYMTGTRVQPQIPSAFSTPAIGSEITILDEDGQPTDNGELFLIPPTLGMSTELVNRDHDQVYFADTPRGQNGQVHRRHGDQVERLPGGYYRAHGRADDTMNLGGIKVSSAEIERVLNVTPGVRETAAIAVPPPGGGPSRLVIYAVQDIGHSYDSTELERLFQQTLRRDLNPLFHIHEVVIVDTLPRTASNKVMRRELRSWYAKECS